MSNNNRRNTLKRTQSTESTSSVASTSSQRFSGGSGRADSGYEYSTTAAVTTSYSRNVADVCAIVIHCPKHKKFALAPIGSHRGLWFPYCTIKQSEGWYASIVNKIRQLLNVRIGTKSLSVFTAPEIMHIMRIQLPEVLKYVSRTVFMTNLLTMSVASPSLTNSGAYRTSVITPPPHPPPSAHSNNANVNNNNNNNDNSKPKGSPDQKKQGSKSSSGNTNALPVGSFHCFCESKEPLNGLIWLDHDTIVSEEDFYEIWGPEPAIFTSAFATNSVERGAHSEYTLREAVKYQARDPALNHQEELLNSCHVERNDVLRLYSDYVQHCYPSQNMNFISFRDYMLRLGYEDKPSPNTTGQHESSSRVESTGSGTKSLNQATPGSGSGILAAGSTGGLNGHDLHSLYRAFKLNKMPYVTFHELLLGLAAMDRTTVHGGRTGEMRCTYIFRYYDTNGDGKLEFEELKQMAYDRLRMSSMKQVAHSVRDSVAKTANDKSHSKSQSSSRNLAAAAVAAATSIKIDSESVKRELAAIYKMLKLAQGEAISEANFMSAVGTMQLRGTSLLFRSQVSVVPVKQHYEVLKERQALTDIEGNLVGGELQRMGTCPRCKEKHYKLALHTVKLTQDAQIIEPTEVRFDEYPPPITRSERQLSRAIFSSDSTPNKLIDMITNYWNAVAASQHQQTNPTARMLLATTNAVPLGKTQWERLDRQTLSEYIKRVCAQAENIFKQEARVVPVTSPCYVLGDIHGNLTDLRIYERILWPGAPTCVPGSYLFLGDYVDRGDYGLECICYLISMKVLAPKTFFLLRGNHELRSIQQAFTFFREVCEKFRNQQLGVQVWETLNKTFDLMPVAATIDDQIFCSHGGIPTTTIRLDELYNIPSPLTDPENQSPPAWEILWNDPVSSTEYSEYADLLRKQPGGQQAVANMQGYLPNTKRGTAFFFSEEAVKRFLHLNNLSYIIRAHECVPPGYALHCNGRVITIFSSSHYCGATNDAACILVEKEKIRIIRLDTD